MNPALRTTVAPLALTMRILSSTAVKAVSRRVTCLSSSHIVRAGTSRPIPAFLDDDANQVVISGLRDEPSDCDERLRALHTGPLAETIGQAAEGSGSSRLPFDGHRNVRILRTAWSMVEEGIRRARRVPVQSAV